ncbi:MAG TPA: tetratricopeptide repeat protein [Xanthomonadales bacterium]|nr:tetratricopeptide repeat protein [Xanthomonadales bacterium]
MTKKHSFLSATLIELTRRKVLSTVGAYAVAVFVLLQLMDAAVEPLRLPDWLPTIVVIVLILGFPVVFLLAWQFELTSEGIRKAQPAGVLTRRQSMTMFASMLLVTFGLGYGFYVYYSGLFAVEAPAALTEQAKPERNFTAPANSIAVLPFTDLSATGDQAYFSDGVAEEILNLLAQVKGLHVAARTSSFAFRGEQHDIREIGQLLNVSTVLEGSIRTAGNRIRLTAQLINVEDGFHIWSQSFDREIDDLFAIQDEIASDIAAALVDSFSGLTQPSAGVTDSLAASNAYRTGRLHWWRRTPAELEKALGYFAEALEHDATYAPAYAGLADSWLLIGMYGNLSIPDSIEKASPMIEKALTLDPRSAEAFAALGLARWKLGQYDSAESAFLRAIELNDNYIPAHLWLGGVLSEQGRFPEEQRVLEHAMSLDPLNELLAINYSANLAIRGQNVKALELLADQVKLRPDSTVLLRSYSQQQYLNGNLVEAWRVGRRAVMLEPENPADLAAFAMTWMTLGDFNEAEQVLQQGIAVAGNNHKLQSTYWLNLLLTGRLEEAEALVREMIKAGGDEPPESIRRGSQLQLAMLALARNEWAAAETQLAASLEGDDTPGYNMDRIYALTLGAITASRVDNKELATQRLDAARRELQRARVNGVDDANIFYSEAALMALEGDLEEAVAKLQQAYDKGFREKWMLALDWRLEPLRDQVEFIELKTRIEQDLEHSLAEIRSLSLAAL